MEEKSGMLASSRCWTASRLAPLAISPAWLIVDEAGIDEIDVFLKKPWACSPSQPGEQNEKIDLHHLKVVDSLRLSGSNSAVECQLPKLDVAGSIPVSRF